MRARRPASSTLADVALAAAFVLAGGAWLAYRSLAVAANYSQDTTARAFLERWEKHLLRRGRLQRAGATLTGIGTSMFLLAMVANRFASPSQLPTG